MTTPTLPARSAPFVWVTWIRGLLAGDDRCLWKAWLKARFEYQRRESDFDFATWSARHALLVERTVTALQDDEWDVTAEDENSLKRRGQSGLVLAGKPDIIARRSDETLVLDCKTGIPRHSDVAQVWIYLIMLGAHTTEGAHIRGQLVYTDHDRDVAPPDPEILSRFSAILRAIGSDQPPHHNPSGRECRFCDVLQADCPSYVEEYHDAEETDLF
jgi:hypothetical protein